MKIEKIQETFITNNTIAIGPVTSQAPITNDNAPQKISKSSNVAKLSALAERIITDAHALIIEKDPHGSGFIYKSIDRKTGEIVRIWPREVVENMLASALDADARGAVINKIA